MKKTTMKRVRGGERYKRGHERGDDGRTREEREADELDLVEEAGVGAFGSEKGSQMFLNAANLHPNK